jgi:hypothetical protein
MRRAPLGLIAVVAGTIVIGMNFIKAIPDIEHGNAPGNIPYGHVYLIVAAILVAGGLIANAIENRK